MRKVLFLFVDEQKFWTVIIKIIMNYLNRPIISSIVIVPYQWILKL